MFLWERLSIDENEDNDHEDFVNNFNALKIDIRNQTAFS